MAIRFKDDPLSFNGDRARSRIGGNAVAEYLTAHWELSLDAPTKTGRRGGVFHPYLPDPLAERAIIVDNDLAAYAARVEAAVRQLLGTPGADGLEGLARFLLRSEAIASSRIEGLQVSAQQVALVEFADAEGLPLQGFAASARLVANNITTLRRAATELAAAPAVRVEAIVDLHRALLPDYRHQGLRTVQNWIGGSDWHPLDADFVPPPHDRVPALMADLAAYASGAIHAPLIQAALTHAQFETIHPFADGNGRVGRALIHTVLTRRGLTRAAVLPVSMVLLTHSDAYVNGLTRYRYNGSSTGAETQAGLAEWLRTFLQAVEVAVEQAQRFASEANGLREGWQSRLAEHRVSLGLRELPRVDSAVARLLRLLPEAPVVTATTVQHMLGVTFPAARSATEELAGAGILHRRQIGRGTTGYLAREVFDLLTFAERQLASTKWNTEAAAPRRPVPARPQR
jgi:Fic family protein